MYFQLKTNLSIALLVKNITGEELIGKE